MKKLERIVSEGNLSISKFGEEYLFSVINKNDEIDSFISKDIKDIFNLQDIDYDSIEVGKDIFDKLLDNNITYFDKENNMYKLFLYDRLYPIFKELTTKYIKEKDVKPEEINGNRVPEYLRRLWDITIDFDRKIISFDGISDYIEYFPEHNLDILNKVIDFDNLYNHLKNICNRKVYRLHLNLQQYNFNDTKFKKESLDDTVLICKIDYELYHINKIFENADFLK